MSTTVNQDLLKAIEDFYSQVQEHLDDATRLEEEKQFSVKIVSELHPYFGVLVPDLACPPFIAVPAALPYKKCDIVQMPTPLRMESEELVDRLRALYNFLHDDQKRAVERISYYIYKCSSIAYLWSLHINAKKSFHSIINSCDLGIEVCQKEDGSLKEVEFYLEHIKHFIETLNMVCELVDEDAGLPLQ